MKPYSFLAFHLSFWGMIAVVLFFSSPSHAFTYVTGDDFQTLHSSPKEACDTHPKAPFTDIRQSGDKKWMCYKGGINWINAYLRCEDGSFVSDTEASQGYCDGEDPPPPPIDPEGTQMPCRGETANVPQTVCMDGTRYDVGSSGGLMVESGTAWGGTCTSTGDACTGDESQVNPDYNLPVLPKTDQSVEINGTEYPLVESGCGEVAGSLVCTNDPGCGEFNGEWICTGPDNGTEGVPATPTLDYTASGNTTADRAGDQYYYDSDTVNNSTNLGTGGTSDPSDDGKADTPTDGSDSGDPNAPLGQGSCPTGYVQQGVTALPDGSTEANCVRAGDDLDWMGWADDLDMSDELPSGWLDAPEIPGFGGPSSSCPQPSQFTVAGATIDIPFQPVCDLAAMLRPFLIMIGYLIAGWFVFRIVGSNN